MKMTQLNLIKHVEKVQYVCHNHTLLRKTSKHTQLSYKSECSLFIKVLKPQTVRCGCLSGGLAPGTPAMF